MAMNIHTVKKTYKSYVDALQKLHKRGFTQLSRVGSGYTHYLGEDFSSSVGEIKEADGCSFQVASLTDGEIPRIIEKNYHIYNSDFLRLKFYSFEEYIIYYVNSNFKSFMVGETPAERKERLKKENKINSSKKTLSIEFGNLGIGLGWWNEKKKTELRKLAMKCKPEIRAIILKAILEADEEIHNWKTAKENIVIHDKWVGGEK